MEIIYLQKLKNTPKIGIRINKGISELVIDQLEKDNGVRFPQAYKEFLFLVGESSSILGGGEAEHDLLEDVQSGAKEYLSAVGLSIKPFWAFVSYDGGEQFKFFYLDEGDDPPVYYFYEDKHEDENGKESYIIKETDTFSGHISKAIDISISLSKGIIPRV